MEKYSFKLKDKQYHVEVLDITNNIANVVVNGETYTIEIDRQLAKTTNTPAAITQNKKTISPSENNTESKEKSFIKSPLPGKILDIHVKTSDKITRGQTILCIDAMKMENNISSDRDGTVISINVQKGDTVLEGHILLELG